MSAADAKDDQPSDEELIALDAARGDLNKDDLDDLQAAIDEIDFAGRHTTPESLARLRALSTQLVDLVEQFDKGIRKPSPAKQLTPEEDKQYESLLEKGLVAAEQGDLEKARTLLEEALRIDADDPEGLFDLGVVYGRLGLKNPKSLYDMTSHGFDEVRVESEKAAFCFERVLELDPKHAPALVNLAAIYDARGDTSGAIECLKKALEIDPNEAKAREHLRELEESLGKKK